MYLSISNIASIISFYKITITSSSILSVRIAPVASITATSRRSVASIAVVTSTDSVAAVGEVTSIFLILLFAFVRLRRRSLLFYRIIFFKNIRTRSAPCFCFFVSCSTLIGWNTTLSCICCISDLVTFIPSLPNIFSPCFRFSCVKMWTMRFV